jgi:hypothetical protein
MACNTVSENNVGKTDLRKIFYFCQDHIFVKAKQYSSCIESIFTFDNTQYTTGSRHVFCMKTGNKHTYEFCMKYCL